VIVELPGCNKIVKQLRSGHRAVSADAEKFSDEKRGT
jgi:hypothetical protein